jgi:hypothetical protein
VSYDFSKSENLKNHNSKKSRAFQRKSIGTPFKNNVLQNGEVLT